MAYWVVEIYAWSIIWNFFDLMGPQHPLSERVPKILKNRIFDDPFHKKLSVLGILMPVMTKSSGSGSFFWEIRLYRLLRPGRLQRLLRSMRLERFLRPGKSLLWTSESSRFLNSIILRLTSLYFDVLKKIIFKQNCRISCWILTTFL